MTEREIVTEMHEMCIESLSTDIVEKWEEVKLNLERTRKNLQ